ncbi:MAG: tetratricopeptide repeat protein, partial [Planctomycetota bacterium]
LLFVVRRLSKSDFIAGAAAILFVLHPAATESVAWISERKGLLAFLFSSLAILSFLRAVGDGREGRWSRHAVGTFFLVAALLAKGSALVVPFLLILWLVATPRDGKGRAGLRDVAPYLVVTIVITAIHFAVAVATGPAITGGEGSTVARLVTGFPVFARYLRLALLPLGGQSAVPDAAPVAGFELSIVVGLVACAAYATALVVTWRRNRLVFLGLAAIGVCLLPFNNVFPKTTVLFAERYLYFSLAGAALAGGALLARIPARGRLPAAAGTAVVLLALTFLRAGAWSDGVAVFADAREKNQTSWLAAMKHGDALFFSERPEEAAEAYEAADENAASGVERVRARLSRANALVEVGSGPEFVLELLRPVDDLLADAPVGDRDTLKWDLFTKRGWACAASGRDEEAAAAYGMAAQVQPKLALSWANLCTALARLGRVEDAVEAGAKAVRLDPDDEGTAMPFAEALVLVGKIQEAYRSLQAFLTRRPDSFRAQCLAGELDLTLMRPRAARERFVLARSLRPGDARAVRGLTEADLLAARAAFARGLGDEARKRAALAAETDPQDPRPWVFLATLTKDADETDRLLEKAAGLGDGTIGKNALATHRMRRALVRDSRGDRDGAARGVAGAIRAGPERLVAGTRVEVVGELPRLSTLVATESPGRDAILVGVVRFLGERYAEATEAFAEAYGAEVAADRGGSEAAGLALLFRGRSRTGEGKYREAIDDFAVVADQWPDDPWPWYHRSDALLRAGASQSALENPVADAAKLFAGARSAARTALERDPGHLPSRLKVGEIEFAAAEYVDSLRAFGQVKRDYPDHVEPMLDLASLYRAHYMITGEKKYLEEALTELAEAIALEPGNARVRALNGEVLLLTGDAPRAAEELRVAIARDPGLLEARQALVRLLVSQARARLEEGGKEKRATAKKLATRAKGLEAGLAAPHLVMAEIYRIEKDYGPIQEELSWAQTLEPDTDEVRDARASYHKDVGYAYLLKGRKEEALEAFARAIDAESKSVDLDQVRLLLGLDERKPDGPPLDPDVEALLREKTEEARVWFQRAAERRAAGDLEGAAVALKESIKARTSAEAWVELGRIRFDEKRNNEAETAFAKAIRLKPGLPEAHLGLGNVFYLRGDDVGAIASYRRFLRTSAKRGETDTRIRVKALVSVLEERREEEK